MKAFAVQSLGKSPEILDLPTPSSDEGFLVRIAYAGVNPIDYKLVDMLTAASEFPFVMGIDFAGVLERVSSGDHGLEVGARVFGMARTHGSYAQYTVVPKGAAREPLARIPDAVTDEQAATLPVAGVAALGSLHHLDLRPGQRLVIMRASGGVGGYATQIARSRGVHVIGVGFGDTEEAARLGAAEVFDAKAIDVFTAICAAHPDGVDAVLDLVNGKDKIARNADILKPGGKLVSSLNAADEKPFAAHKITAQNLSTAPNPMSSPAGLAQLASLVAEGVITPRIGLVTEFAGVKNMLDDLRHGSLHGKAVIRV